MYFEPLISVKCCPKLHNNYFCLNQYGFRKGHLTEHASLEITDNRIRIIRELDKRKFSLSIFLDLQKAFNTLNFDILL